VAWKRWQAGLFHSFILADKLKLGRDDGRFAHRLGSSLSIGWH
jgi:hypothetical protein